MKLRRLTLKFDLNPPHFPAEHKESAVVLSPKNFSQAKNLLGQEFDWILYDGRTALNLDVLAIAAGTLKAGGELVLWLDRQQQVDLDSVRWSGVEQGIATPNFQRYFYATLENYYCRGVSMCAPVDNYVVISGGQIDSALQATDEQSAIINKILQQQSDLYFITAKRGRGKSALAGMLIHQLMLQQTQQPPVKRIYVTAPNKSAVKTLQDFAGEPLNFMAPDELIAHIQANPTQFKQDWLFIDEAAMLPLSMLFQLMTTFKHIVLTTTIHSYEGTGRGFLLKFMQKIDRTFQHFELIKPLRWAENDPLELWIDDLLLLEAEDRLPQPAVERQKSAVDFRAVSQREIVARIQDFYGLLTLAHYRTSPLDLRRLFDVPQQQFYLAESRNQLLAGVWLMEEGGMADALLIEQICRGERRPKGNLVAQLLAFSYLAPQACDLRSLRISRIAVQSNWQQHGLGQGLIAKIAADAQVDFLSVSFGYTEELARFWQKCGFILVQIGEHQEASSGCYSAIALRGISKQGNKFVTKIHEQFERNFPLGFHPLVEQFTKFVDWQLKAEDWDSLKNFANFHRTLGSSVAAIRRLFVQTQPVDCPLLTEYLQQRIPNFAATGGKKSWLAACRREVKMLLQKS